MIFANRKEAALKLIPYLEKFGNTKSVVLAVPRGGVPIGHLIAKHFNFPLDLLIAKKIGHPSNPEYAIGAVGTEDYIVMDTLDVSNRYIKEKVQQIRTQLKAKYALYSKGNPVSLEGKTVIIVDDGIATGNTILSSIQMLRRKKPVKIVVAVPVAPANTALRMQDMVDEFICPYTLENFHSVGYYYENFSDVTDEEVTALLQDLQQANRLQK